MFLLKAACLSCTDCQLSKTRTQVVFGHGNKDAKIMIIGEAPGYHEDKTGIPFVGSAGKLLDKIINSIGLDRNEVFITNILCCRPPNNRDPQEDEIKECSKWLNKKVEAIKPKVIIALGKFAMEFFIGKINSVGSCRGKIYDIYDDMKIIATYHPAYVLRNKSAVSLVYKDMQLVKKILGEI